jgi:hypothetical protein
VDESLDLVVFSCVGNLFWLEGVGDAEDNNWQARIKKDVTVIRLRNYLKTL